MDYSFIWSDIWHSKSGRLRKSVGVVMTHMMEDTSGDICRALSDLTDVPASFSISLNNGCELSIAFESEKLESQ